MFDLLQIVLGHRFDGRVRLFSADGTARPNADHGATVRQAPRRRQHLDEIAANAMNEEHRRKAATLLERDQRSRAWRTRLSQRLTKLRESRRLADQRQRDLESKRPLEL